MSHLALPPSPSSRMENMNILLTWLFVGLVAGLLASLVMGGTGLGIVGDIIIGILGAVIGAWLFRTMGVAAPFGGIAGTIFVAFVGAVVLLLIIRVVRRGGKRGV